MVKYSMHWGSSKVGGRFRVVNEERVGGILVSSFFALFLLGIGGLAGFLRVISR